MDFWGFCVHVAAVAAGVFLALLAFNELPE